MLLVDVKSGIQGQNGDMMSHDLCPITLTLMAILSTISRVYRYGVSRIGERGAWRRRRHCAYLRNVLRVRSMRSDALRNAHSSSPMPELEVRTVLQLLSKSSAIYRYILDKIVRRRKTLLQVPACESFCPCYRGVSSSAV
jgi:hypothetical protein